MCLVCRDFESASRSDYTRHVTRCVKRNQERFQRHAHLRKSNYFTSVADTERYAHLRNPAGRKTLVTVPKSIPKNDNGGNDDA